MMLEDPELFMKDHPFLQGLKPEFMQTLVGCARPVTFEAGQTIFREGQDANEFFLIRRGAIAVQIYSPQKGAIVIETLKEGDVLGWSWLVPPYKWRFDAQALEVTRAIGLNGACLRGKCDENPALGYELLKRFSVVFSQRLQATRFQLLDVYKK